MMPIHTSAPVEKGLACIASIRQRENCPTRLTAWCEPPHHALELLRAAWPHATPTARCATATRRSANATAAIWLGEDQFLSRWVFFQKNKTKET